MRTKAFLLEFDRRSGELRLAKKVDYTDAVKDNYEEKKVMGKGFSKKKTARKVASIPLDVLMSLPPEKFFEIMNDDNALRKFLRENPQFRCSEGDV